MKKSEREARKNLLSPGDEISVSVGLTLQIQERNFVKIDVMASTKIRPGETGDQAFDRATEFAEERMNEKAQEYSDSMR